MNQLKKKYELVNPDAKPIDTDEYLRKAKEEYASILSYDYHESIYQTFFEKNPAFLPGAYEIIGNATGHAPHMNALISQPIIGDGIQRKPDFMWLAKNSLCFCPVLIEIERPSKEEFRKDEYCYEIPLIHVRITNGHSMLFKSIDFMHKECRQKTKAQILK